MLASSAAHSQATTPPCWPRQLGSTGSDFKRGETADGRWVGWTCQVNGAPKVFGAVAVAGYEIQHPDITGLSPTKAATAYWRANTIDTADPRLTRLRADMHAALR